MHLYDLIWNSITTHRHRSRAGRLASRRVKSLLASCRRCLSNAVPKQSWVSNRPLTNLCNRSSIHLVCGKSKPRRMFVSRPTRRRPKKTLAVLAERTVKFTSNKRYRINNNDRSRGYRLFHMEIDRGEKRGDGLLRRRGCATGGKALPWRLCCHHIGRWPFQFRDLATFTIK